ncbi:hypothetical protein [Paenibacillus apiarius]|uniref:hypothetical protein n=1 Tax=Paenibacillus apiarius TaxID=46240 RepID=UPI001981AF30|nr:hypothetical protein [Paenibacillus apiarius]MBN3527257.1 hypothetical protein [Paenibacillus apiarius]
MIELGNSIEAKTKLDKFSKDDDEFVGEVDVADLYVELGCFKEAAEWFEKGWDIYWKQPSWISRYIYSLFELNHSARAHEILNEVIKQKIEDIKEANDDEDDGDWSESDKQAYIKNLLDEKIRSYVYSYGSPKFL